MNRDNIHSLRENYSQDNLERSDLHDDPLVQFRRWFDAALENGVKEPNAMILSTVNENNFPSARTVLMKDLNEEGITFYTNLESAKAKDIAQNNRVSLTFLWLKMERQVRINGIATQVSEDTASQYFKSRPKDSQIGAWASDQSRLLSDRKELEAKVAQIQQQYRESETLPKPPHWGGYLVKPQEIEFWQGRRSRLHDRFRYSLDEDESWKIDRLYP